MSDFENNDFNSGNGNNPRPDYYQPNHNGPYYNPPKSENTAQQNNTTYHYAYNTSQQTNQNNTYQPRDNGYNYNPFQNVENNSTENKPQKKSNASKIIVIVLVICLVVAAIGIAAAAMGKTDSSDKKDENPTAQVQSDEDAAKLNSTEAVPTKDSGGNYTVAGVYEKCVDSCVGITVYSQKADVYNYFYSYGQGNSGDEPTQSGEGSGVIMSEQNGKTYILTCAHVISDADSFTVTLNDGTELDAQMVGYDAQTDIGVLAVNETGLQIAEFGDSSELIVGEQVVAIGCPGGLEFMNSQTSGYISALDRPISSKIGYDTNCIQIDAAINPGNSGGALFNMQGQVIGINSSKIAATEYEGMGFAVPSATAVATANSLIKVGYVEGRAKLGVTYNPITNFNNSGAVIQALDQKGFKDCQGAMVIDSVDEESDLFGQDIKQYDMIVAVNGETMTSTDVMTSILADSKPGDTITLTIARIENNDIRTFELECKLIESKG